MSAADMVRLPLTPHELDFARIIQEFDQIYHRSPTYAELANEMDLKSKSGVTRFVQRLRDKGWLTPRGKFAAYSLQLTGPVPPVPGFSPEIDGDAAVTIAREAIVELEKHTGQTEKSIGLTLRLIEAIGDFPRAAALFNTPQKEPSHGV